MHARIQPGTSAISSNIIATIDIKNKIKIESKLADFMRSVREGYLFV